MDVRGQQKPDVIDIEINKYKNIYYYINFKVVDITSDMYFVILGVVCVIFLIVIYTLSVRYNKIDPGKREKMKCYNKVASEFPFADVVTLSSLQKQRCG